ncbi:MAG: O-methyltransferase involved in polyketide biosynthesis [Flavobacteriaceae bacterium]|jgi:O-methyltransferase involved in polyketide biosynthesis
MNKEDVKTFNKSISDTAWVTPYSRTFSDIPYAKEIFEIMENLKEADKRFTSEDINIDIFPKLEGRYKIVNHLLKEFNSHQILEIAPGFSPRGLELTDNSDTLFVEMDLPDIAKEKQIIIDTIYKSNTKHPNLYLENGNAFEFSDFQKATLHFEQNKPISIICEGFLRYLNFEEKTLVAQNIFKVLKKFNGIWITPDISIRSTLNSNNLNYRKRDERIKELTGVDLDQNLFADESEAKKFFEEFGFSVERHTFDEVSNQISCTKENVQKTLSTGIAFVMKIKNT